MDFEIDKYLECTYKEKEKCDTIHRLIPDKDGELIPLSMENCYINLTVVKHICTELHGDRGLLDENQCPKEKEEYRDVRQSFNRPRSSEELNLEDEENTIFQIEDIFEKRDKSSKRIFMLGRAGIGKTTLCKKIVYDYYCNDLWKENFDRIIWLPLRIFKRKSISDLKSPSLADIFALHFFSSGDIVENKEKGEKLIEENGQDETKVLYILDGLDEIQNLVGNRQSELSRLVAVLCEKPFVIVTSRPYTYHNNFNNFDTILETIGFSTDNILDYVKVVFSNPSDFEKQKEIIEFIDKSPGNISGIGTIPILLDIICFTWADIKILTEKFQITMTRLYAVLEKYLWGQFLVRIKKIDAEQWRNTVKKKVEIYALVNKYVKVGDLPKIAYKMLGENKIEFTTEEAMREQEFGPQERILLKNANFLHCLNPVDEEVNEILKSYVFLHLTIQEYLAAVHIANCFKENRQEFDKAIYHKYNPRYSIVWSFVSGILADSHYEFGYENDIETFYNYLERDPIDVLGIAHQHLILNCLNECTYPSVLNEERENRLMDDLYNYIFAQYVADGKSLFQQQLPLKVLMKILGPGDENWGNLVSEWFKIEVLRLQFLPDEIITTLLNNIGNARDFDAKVNEKILRRQNNLSLATFNKISEKIILDITKNKGEHVNTYLEILRTKRFLPSDERTLNTIGRLIDYASKRRNDVKGKVLDVCLRLREIPFTILQQIVVKFGKEKIKIGISESETEWKKRMLLVILSDKVSYPLDKMMPLVSQKCFLNVIEEFISNELCPENSSILYRLILVASREKFKDGLNEKLLHLHRNIRIPFDVSRISLFVIGNSKILSDDEAEQLVEVVERVSLSLEMNISDDRKKLIYPPAHRVPEINFTYLVSLIPLMKLEFYERLLKKQSKNRSKQIYYLSRNKYDLIAARILDKSFVSEICQGIKKEGKGMSMRRHLHDELWGNWELLPAAPSEWMTEFHFDIQRFLKNLAVIYENLFDDLPDETEFSNLRTGKYFRIFFSDLLEEERRTDLKLYYTMLEKYRPLVVFAHHLYNNKKRHMAKYIYPETIKKLESMREKFESLCEQVLLENLAVRALQNCETSKEFVSDLERRLCEQISPNRNFRCTMNIMRILEFKHLRDNAISKMIDLIDTGDEYEVEIASSLLSRQTIANSADIERLKLFLREEHNFNVDRSRNYRYISNIFQVNSKLLTHIRDDIFPKICDTNFESKFKAMKVLHSSQISDENILEEIPCIINEMCTGHHSHHKMKLVTICLDVLLNQKKLSEKVLEKMVDYFDDFGELPISVYLGFLNLLRIPLPKKCLESLYKAIDDHLVCDICEFTTQISDSEKSMLRILRKQPLWNLLESKCDYKFKIDINGERQEQNYSIKDKVIVEKILQDKMPMAIQKQNGKLCCFCPNSEGEYPLLEFGSVDIEGILEKLLERHGRTLKLPKPIDTITRFLRFHTQEENLKYIRALQDKYTGSTFDTSNFFIKFTTNPSTDDNNEVEYLETHFRGEEYRHVDLSGNDFTDGNILAQNFRNLFSPNGNSKVKRLTTLILSDNRLTIAGLTILLTQFQKFEVDYLFLDRNMIFLTTEEIQMFINSKYRNFGMSEDFFAREERSQVKYLDLSMNFISNGEEIVGGSLSGKKIIPREHMNDIKDFITNSSIFYSQDLTVAKFSQDLKYDQRRSYCDFLCYPRSQSHQNISTEMGCILIAEKQPDDFLGRWLYNRGHAFMAIEWIPDPKYGQRQIILAHLEKGNQSRLQIEIVKAIPSKLKEKVERCRTRRAFLETAENIKEKLIPRLCQSKNQADVFDYFIFASQTDRAKRGRYNCITWTDEMLEVLDIKVDSMQKSRTRLYTILLVSSLLSAVILKLLLTKGGFLL